MPNVITNGNNPIQSIHLSLSQNELIALVSHIVYLNFAYKIREKNGKTMTSQDLYLIDTASKLEDKLVAISEKHLRRQLLPASVIDESIEEFIQKINMRQKFNLGLITDAFRKK